MIRPSQRGAVTTDKAKIGLKELPTKLDKLANKIRKLK
jgi:predicted transcriptional regulator